MSFILLCAAADKNANETRVLVSTQPLLSLSVIIMMLYVVFLVSLSFICAIQAGTNCRPNAILFSNIANATLFSNLTTNGTNPVLKHHHFHQLIIARNQSYYHSSNSILIDSIYLEVSNMSHYRLSDSHWVRRSPFNRSRQISVHTSKAHGQLKWSVDVELHYTLRYLRCERMLVSTLCSEARLGYPLLDSCGLQPAMVGCHSR